MIAEHEGNPVITQSEYFVDAGIYFGFYILGIHQSPKGFSFHILEPEQPDQTDGVVYATATAAKEAGEDEVARLRDIRDGLDHAKAGLTIPEYANANFREGYQLATA